MISSSAASTVASFASASVTLLPCTTDAVPASISSPSTSGFSSFLTMESDPVAPPSSPYCWSSCCSTFTWSG
uniref:Putative secreted protein n=1 Tax=Anopheles darlingi TaxID=43151 RepID=A0A2M4DEU4_ANODA